MTAGPGALYLDYFLATDGRPGPGAVYVLHFLEPIGNPANRRAMARHYIGWSPDPPKRIARHTAGQGAAIVRAVQARGIGFTVAVVWPGDRRLERKLKRRHDAPRWCPVCRGEVAGERRLPARAGARTAGRGSTDSRPRTSVSPACWSEP